MICVFLTVVCHLFPDFVLENINKIYVTHSKDETTAYHRQRLMYESMWEYSIKAL